MHEFEGSIEAAFRGESVPNLSDTLTRIYRLLESGEVRVAELHNGRWTTNEWVKKAILLSFKHFDQRLYDDGVSTYFDRIPPRFKNQSAEDFRRLGVRVTPGAVVRSGAHIGRNVVLMPCFINVGAYVGEGTMIDTWATVGSCAQVGANVHVSGGVERGGATPIQSLCRRRAQSRQVRAERCDRREEGGRADTG